MRGEAEILQLLNEQLTSELTAINQYFLHSKMQDSWGFTELAAHTRAESFEEMRHAELLTDRILLLDGLPNYQRLFSVRIARRCESSSRAISPSKWRWSSGSGLASRYAGSTGIRPAPCCSRR
jgi:bacterioferritin